MKIFCYGVSELDKPYIKKWAEANSVEVGTTSEALTAKTSSMAKGYDGVSTTGFIKVEPSVYADFESYGIKQLAVRQVGFDNQDLDAAKKHGIAITNVRAYSPRAIAEMGLTHTMYLLRHIGVYKEREANGDFTWDRSTMSHEIFSQTIGLVGAGHIGGALAEIFKSLGAKVLIYDPIYDASIEAYGTYTDLDTVLSQADIVSLHTPLLPSTKNIIDAAALKKMKKSAILINMSRGGLVDNQALIAALKNGEIAGAGVDTLPNETEFFAKKQDPESLPADYRELAAMPNVLITPHVAFFTELSVRNMVEIALNAAKTIIEGGKCRDIVNR